MSGGGYSTERSESYAAADTPQTATLDLKHRRRNNPTSPTPTYDSYSPDLVILLHRVSKTLHYTLVHIFARYCPYGTMLCRLFDVNVCIVAKQYVLLENCLKRQVGLPDCYPVVPIRIRPSPSMTACPNTCIANCWPTVGRVAYTVVHLVTHHCTGGLSAHYPTVSK